MDLFKISHAGREQLLVLFARHITVQVFSLPLRVAHLAQNPAIRAGDTLDSTHGAVGIPLDIHAGIPIQIHVLGGDLARWPSAAPLSGHPLQNGPLHGKPERYGSGPASAPISHGDLTEVTLV